MGWTSYTPIGAAYNALKKAPIIGGVLSGPQTASTAPSQAGANAAAGLSSQIQTDISGNPRPTYVKGPDGTWVMSAPAGGGTPFTNQQQAGLLAQQQANIAGLTAQANGTAPSAAQIQLQQQAGANEAGAYGMAAALQGRNPGEALRQAQLGATATQAATNAQLAAQRASDQQAGQQALTGALGGMQSQSVGAQQGLIGAQLGAVNAQVNAATGLQNATTANAAANNTYYGGILNAAAGAGTAAAVKSDRTSKTEVEHADLDKLADALQGFLFRYKGGEGPAGERVGVMAQDALRGGPLGKGMVERGGDGKLQLDGGNAVGAALALSAEALKRTRKAA